MWGRSQSPGGKPLGQMCWSQCLLGGLQILKDGAPVVQAEAGGRGSSLAEVEAEDGAGEDALLQHALQGCGGASLRQGRVAHAHDAVKLCIDEIGTRLGLTQAELLVGDLDVLDLWRGRGDTEDGR